MTFQALAVEPGGEPPKGTPQTTLAPWRTTLTSLPFRTALAVLVPLSLFFALIFRRLGSALIMPDYGDLWRLAVQSDDALTVGHVFGELEVLGHNTSVTILAADYSAQRGDYGFLWLWGSAGAVVGSAIVALVAMHAIPSHVRLRAVIAAGIGLLTFRADVPGTSVNSLLLFEQIYYAAAYGALLALVYFGAREVDRSATFFESTHRPPWGFMLAVSLLVYFADAPGSVWIMTTIGVASVAVLFRPFRRLGIVALATALLSILVRWLVQLTLGVPGGRGTTSGLSSATTDVVPDTLRLLGASFVNAEALGASVDTRSTIYLWLGAAFIALGSYTCITGYRAFSQSTGQARHDQAVLLIAVALLTAFPVVSSLGIGVSRGLTPGTSFDLGRFMRSTALVVPATLLMLVALVAKPASEQARQTNRLKLLLLPLAIAVLVLVRVPGVNDLRNGVGNVADSRIASAQLLCDQNPSTQSWARYWGPLRDADRISTLINSDRLFSQTRQLCSPAE